MFSLNVTSFLSHRGVTEAGVVLAAERDWGNRTEVWKSRIKKYKRDRVIRPCDVL